MNFRNIQRESLLFMSSAELFLGNIAQTSAVAQGDVQVTADKSAAARRSWRRGRLAGAGRRRGGRNVSDENRSRPDDGGTCDDLLRRTWMESAMRSLNSISAL